MSLEPSPDVTTTPGEAPPKRAVLLVNTKSRRGQEWFEQAKVVLGQKGIQLEAAKSFKTIDKLLAEAKTAIDRNVPLLIAGGGDGTFNALADLYVDHQTVMGVLPLGTGNSFARDLGIPADLETACDVIANGKVVHVDLGWANGTHFVNVATVGLTTKIAQGLTVPMKRKFGRFVYAIVLTQALKKIKPFRAKLTTEFGTHEFETLQVVVGNGRFHAGPFPLSPDATITEGRLSLYALRKASKLELLKMALLMPFGRQGSLAGVHQEECTRGRLETFPPMAVTVDGEVCPTTPLEFRIAPKALRVVAPQEFAG
ncbi:lipid kinase [bacterium]|nr:MAG: lipid kinase [bacterium]